MMELGDCDPAGNFDLRDLAKPPSYPNECIGPASLGAVSVRNPLERVNKTSCEGGEGGTNTRLVTWFQHQPQRSGDGPLTLPCYSRERNLMTKHSFSYTCHCKLLHPVG